MLSTTRRAIAHRAAAGIRPGLGRLTRHGIYAVAVIALVSGISRFGSGGTASSALAVQDDSTASPAATREADLATIAALQTQVAELQTKIAEECAEPTPTVEPTPIPPLPAGQAIPYGNGWTVTVIGASTRPTIETETAQGAFVVVVLSVTNNSAELRRFPANDFVLLDAQQRAYNLDTVATNQLSVDWASPVAPSLSADLQLVFEVAADAGETFVLESTKDPTVRVQVIVAPRG